MAAGDPTPTWTHEDFLSSACPRCKAVASQPCKANVAPLTTGEGDAEWHEERRPIAGTWICGSCFTRHPDPPQGYSMCCSCGTIDLETQKPRTTLRPMTGRNEEAVKCPACLAPPGDGCDGPRSHPSRIDAYRAHLHESTELHTPRLARLLVTPSDHEVFVRGCSCGADVTSAELFAEHVGWPADAVKTMLRLTGLVYDVFDYHEAVTRTHIDKALETYLTVRS